MHVSPLTGEGERDDAAALHQLQLAVPSAHVLSVQPMDARW